MHFCELAARRSFASSEPGAAWPTKIGLNWFIPALQKSSVGSSYGTTGDDATAVCSFAAKKSTNCVRTFAGHSPITVASCRRTCGRSAVRSRPAAGRIIDAVHSRAPTSMLRRGDVQAIWAATASELVGAAISRRGLVALQNLIAISV